MARSNKTATKKASKTKGSVNRIVGYDLVPASSLKPHPKNPRNHPDNQRAVVAESMDKVGIVMPLLVNKRSGYLLNGHLRASIEADKDGMVPIAYVDLTPDEERLMLASLDPTGGMALTNARNLDDLLSELNLDVESFLSQMLTGMRDDAELLKPAPVSPTIKAEGRTPRQLGDRKTQVKMVLYVPQTRVVEKALQLVGDLNRGRAIVAVCEFYVGANSDD